MKKRVIIMGAAGRDFHNFNTRYREDADTVVVAFTATQIPYISERTYPALLAGPLYPDGIPIYPEERLAELIKSERVDTVVFSYSDVDFDYVMERASLCASLGAGFELLGAGETMLTSAKHVISVTATRTGCGKSGVSRLAAAVVRGLGLKPVAIRHPMPYGDLAAARVQRFANHDDMTEAGCTVEEREEYEPLVDAGVVVFAGVDYAAILEAAEREADVIIWDGGNNDMPFIAPGLDIVVADALRPEHVRGYWPGEVNFMRAVRDGVVIINKSRSADIASVRSIEEAARDINPRAKIVHTASTVTIDGEASALKGLRVVVIEDGPTLTHGGMSFGAGIRAARLTGAVPVDVRDAAVGSIRDTFRKYPGTGLVLPAMGYSAAQLADLEATIDEAEADAVLSATPVDITRLITIEKPVYRVRYEVEDIEDPGLAGLITAFLEGGR